MYQRFDKEICEDCCHNYAECFKKNCEKCVDGSEKYSFDSLNQDMEM